ncbi:myc box-dependent-interacting protein 1 isoform X2 [Electrophorus electricus]|uniref:myc box-dependent-interacting protein 1 isoform X2 n=1 Tax=Electrophorus electricus TaxID=8005 RepID=UPI0015D04666|nr:myc box-dependent-interacting protein 1 isoform X2 [Electrophorus electricus]
MAELTVGKGVSAGKIASNVQKKITRAQEKVLQKLGKADETKDLAFEEGVINFNKQLAEGTKLQKDLRAYLAAVKAMHESSSRLQECLADMYDPDWYGKEEMDSTIEDSDLLWTDFHQKLVDHALISMDTYLGQFPDIKARIAKRDRKLVDYDSARHNFAAVNKGKKKEGGIKISKPASLLERATPGWAQGILSAHNVAQSNLSRCQAEEELERAQKVFEDINIDLQEELPSLWNSRVGFYVNTFQSVAGLEEKFHRETGKLSQNMHDILVKLENQDMSRKAGNRGGKTSATQRSDQTQDTNHTLSPGGPPAIPKSPSKLRPAVPPPPKVTPSKDLKQDNIINLFDEAAATPAISVTSPTQYDTPVTSHLLDMDLDALQAATTPVASGPAPQQAESHGEVPQTWDDEDDSQPVRTSGGDGAAQPTWEDDGSRPAHTAEPIHPAWDDDGSQPVRTVPAAQPTGDDDGSQPVQAQGWDSDGAQGAESSVATEEVAGPAEADKASTEVEMPPGFLNKVKTMHDYNANDSDELELKAGDVVLVVTYDNADEQDEGWLMGVKEADWLQTKDLSKKGVFPENFTQKM